MQTILSALAVAATMLAPTSPALPDADLATVSEAGGELFWASPSAHGKVTLHTRSTSGGVVRSLGIVRTLGGSPSVAFDGTTYAVSRRSAMPESGTSMARSTPRGHCRCAAPAPGSAT